MSMNTVSEQTEAGRGVCSRCHGVDGDCDALMSDDPTACPCRCHEPQVQEAGRDEYHRCGKNIRRHKVSECRSEQPITHCEHGIDRAYRCIDCIEAERDALRAEVERLNRILGRIVEGDGDSNLTIRAGTDAFAAAREYLRPNT